MPHSVLYPTVVGSDTAVAVCLYCINAYAWGESASVNEPSRGHFMLVTSEQAGGMTTQVNTLEGWGGLSILWLCSCLNGEQARVHPLTLGEHRVTLSSVQSLWTGLSWGGQCWVHAAVDL